MRILHIVSNISIRNGIMTVLMNYYRNMQEENVQFSFLYYDEKDETYEDEILKLGGEIYRFSRKTFPTEWNVFSKENYGKFDVLHNHELYLSLFFWAAKKDLGVKCLISHAHATKFSDKKVNEMRNKILSLPSRRSEYLLACSTDAGKRLFRKHFMTKGYILRNAIDISRYAFDVEQRRSIRNAYGIEDRLVLGHVGNFAYPKNHSYLLEIFYEIVKIKPDSVLLLVGEGCLYEDIKVKALELGIEKNVIFVGATKYVEHYLSAMDIFIFPSRFEGLGIALVEAQANGLPCVYSDAVPKEADVIRENNICLSLNDSPKLWAKEILEVEINRYLLGNEMEVAGYDISKEASQLVQFYKDVLDRRKPISLRRGNRNEL